MNIELELNRARTHGPDGRTVDALVEAADQIEKLTVERDAALYRIEELEDQWE